MMYELQVRQRARSELQQVLQDHAQVGHDRQLLAELDLVFEMLRTMPRRFPQVIGSVHRALLRKYPYAVFFRIRTDPIVVVLAVLHQRRNPERWPR
jgi:plasmid stabilization system protein ParE